MNGFAVAADAIVACGVCGAKEGKPCKPVKKDRGKPWRLGTVHIGRRIKRLLLTAKATPEERAKIEKALIATLKKPSSSV
jgi:hypothetical protein